MSRNRLDMLREHLAEGRQEALEVMEDTVRITKPGTGDSSVNEETGQIEGPEPVVVYEGPCRIQVRADVNSNVVEVTAGEKEWAYQTLTLAIPVETVPVAAMTPAQAALYPGGTLGDPVDVRIDHTATMLTSAHDPTLPGRRFQIRAIHHKTHATSRRLRITEAM